MKSVEGQYQKPQRFQSLKHSKTISTYCGRPFHSTSGINTGLQSDKTVLCCVQTLKFRKKNHHK